MFTKATIAAKWENFLKPVSSGDIQITKEKYQGSIMERNDILREAIVSKGSMTHLLNNIPFMRNEDELRVIEIIKNLMDTGEIPKMTIRKLRK